MLLFLSFELWLLFMFRSLVLRLMETSDFVSSSSFSSSASISIMFAGLLGGITESRFRQFILFPKPMPRPRFDSTDDMDALMFAAANTACNSSSKFLSSKVSVSKRFVDENRRSDGSLTWSLKYTSIRLKNGHSRRLGSSDSLIAYKQEYSVINLHFAMDVRSPNHQLTVITHWHCPK